MARLTAPIPLSDSESTCLAADVEIGVGAQRIPQCCSTPERGVFVGCGADSEPVKPLSDAD